MPGITEVRDRLYEVLKESTMFHYEFLGMETQVEKVGNYRIDLDINGQEFVLTVNRKELHRASTH